MGLITAAMRPIMAAETHQLAAHLHSQAQNFRLLRRYLLHLVVQKHQRLQHWQNRFQVSWTYKLKKKVNFSQVSLF